MKIYLIRHAETVDNVAGLYAGVRDSKLTVHGTEQAARLGAHFAQTSTKFTQIFCSPLTRTVKTAEAIQKAQASLSRSAVKVEKPEEPEKSGHDNDDGSVEHPQQTVEIVKVPDLIEQDFGFYEGKLFHARSEPRKTGRESDAEKRRLEEGFVDVESRESMGKRADAFLDAHLLPLFEVDSVSNELCVALVSHGMLLSTLWRRLLLRLPRKSLTIAPEVTAARGPLVLEHLGGWSNTGYLELSIRKNEEAASEEGQVAGRNTNATSLDSAEETSKAPRVLLSDYSTTIIAVDSKQHLVGLKRQRGGIGRLAHDEGQRKLDGFFTKRQKLG